MKRTLLGILMMLLMVSITWAGQQMSVQVRKANVKASPTFTSQTVGTVSYGTHVNVSAENNNWAQVDSPSGWLHLSALTKHDLQGVKTDYSGRGVTSDETALAGKGFNPSVEKEYVSSNRGLSTAYRDVDRVETYTATDVELKEFAKSGDLTMF